jgi:hypothetical protein
VNFGVVMTIYSYTKAKQIMLYLVLGLLPIVGLVCFYQSLDMWEASKWAWFGFWVLVSFVFLGLFFLGLRWRAFIPMGVEVTEDGLVLHQGTSTTVHQWERIGAVKNWPLLQLLVIFDAQGKVLVPVDHMLTGFEQFKQSFDAHLNKS